MFEIFLFIDPLCKECEQSEEAVVQLSKDMDSKFKFQFIPIFNLKVIQTDFCHSNNQLKKILSSNELSSLYHDVVLDYKAALFQGMRNGRSFFMDMQDKILNDGLKYTNDLSLNIAENNKLDISMFEEDRRSNLAKNTIQEDQKIVKAMNIKKPASAVIFNCENPTDNGILTNNVCYSELFNTCCEDNLTKDSLNQAIKHSKKHKSNFHIVK
ncbi:DsbA family protein [Apilactobacillus apisilvae]|uniref:DsbA family protein n=1 Tax=Apilactobacillus apisilvae TaxID=2923364 RepID=A0ABY4PJ72_9LACO|nr:DsbA family protein [Apilactobacillus apisilvae]UQS85558.1 DsbA family protein [Apilactobacillus apisilvae]